MIMSVVSDGDKIIVPRNVHKSVTSGIILSGAIPIFMQPELDKKLGIAHGVSPKTVEKTLKDNPDAKALLLINPTYYGVATDIKKIAEIVHSYHIPLIVDEAHGPHLAFSRKLPMSALEAGADICSQSTHKIIGSLTQASLIHIKSKFINPNRVQRNLNLLQTTSPSYILMASLDCARRQIALHGENLLNKAIELANYTRNEINKIPGFYCFGKEILGKPGSFAFDPTKITICCRNLGITGFQLDMILYEKYAIQMELSDFYNVLAVGSFGDTKEGMDRLLTALKEISKEYYGVNKPIADFLDIPPIPTKIINPREAFYADKKSVALKSAVGIGGLLALGIGDTMRVSLSADPVEEVYAARDILKAAGVRREGAELVSCPTCGRTRIDLIGLAAQVEERLKGVDKPITVAVMGCAVNGPGEASAADCGIAGGIGEGLLFRKGEIVKKVPQDRLVDELFALIEEL